MFKVQPYQVTYQNDVTPGEPISKINSVLRTCLPQAIKRILSSMVKGHFVDPKALETFCKTSFARSSIG